MKKIIYKTDLTPNHLTLHALFATLMDNHQQNNKELEYKIYFQDKQIFIIVKELSLFKNIPDTLSFSHDGKNINLKKVSIEDFKPIEFNTNECVRISGMIYYSIHKLNENNKSKNICPITLNGTFAENTKQHTLKYLSEKSGVNLLDENFIRDHRFEYIPSTNFKEPHSKTNNKEIKFCNAFYLDVTGFIKDKNTLNKLQYSSIGRKRNYGFGNLFINKVNNE